VEQPRPKEREREAINSRREDEKRERHGRRERWGRGGIWLLGSQASLPHPYGLNSKQMKISEWLQVA
jgi:hypothetical protein